MRSRARTKDEFKGSEKRMRNAIKSFMLLSADSKSEIADDCDQIDMGLIDRKSTADIEACTNPSYYRLWAIIEARLAKTSKDACGAFAQLCRHTQQMFTEQYDLRFTFGFTVCAGEVCLYHFGNNKIVASAPMDIATREGRRSFIELLINLSLCEISQLGRDPTI
ncbi:hypothetical protein H4218_004339 [Coemansia sp. IMI 209128]|nr:hypothetical protein H4218_004339 [Coemansia sp. IMI 209128]